MEAPKMQEMDTGETEDMGAPYLGLFASTFATTAFSAPTKKFLLLEKRRLMTYRWASRLSSRKGLIVLVHGFGEHLGRYFHVANFFAEQGYDVCGIDHVVHGLSDGSRGPRGTLELEELLHCWTQFVVKEVIPLEGPHYVYSHSTGGMVTFLALNRTQTFNWEKLAGVVYSAPLIKQPSMIAKPIYCCPGLADCCLSCGICCCGTSCLLDGVTTGQLSSYKALEEATRKDPFYFGWKVNLSMVKTLADGTVLALQQLKQPKYPFLVMISPKDQLVDTAAAKALFEQAASSTKSFEMDAFASCGHEIHNEEDWQKPLQMALQFLQSLSASE